MSQHLFIFPFLCYHQGIFVSRMITEQRSYLVLIAHLSSLIPCWSPTLSLSLVYSIWAITQSFLVHLYIVHSLAPTHLSQETKLTLKLKKYQQPCPTMRKMIFSWIHHDIHQEIAYDVHNSLYNMIDYFSWPNLWIYHNNLIFYGHKSSNNV
jgi:hypothetical protein